MLCDAQDIARSARVQQLLSLVVLLVLGAWWLAEDRSQMALGQCRCACVCVSVCSVCPSVKACAHVLCVCVCACALGGGALLHCVAALL